MKRAQREDRIGLGARLKGTAPVRALGRRAVAALDQRERAEGAAGRALRPGGAWALARLRLLEAIPEAELLALEPDADVRALARRRSSVLDEAGGLVGALVDRLLERVDLREVLGQRVGSGLVVGGGGAQVRGPLLDPLAHRVGGLAAPRHGLGLGDETGGQGADVAALLPELRDALAARGGVAVHRSLPLVRGRLPGQRDRQTSSPRTRLCRSRPPRRCGRTVHPRHDNRRGRCRPIGSSGPATRSAAQRCA